MKRVNAKEILGDIHLKRPEELNDAEKEQLLIDQEAEEAKIDAEAGVKVDVGATDFRPPASTEKKQRMPRQPIKDVRPTALSEEMDQAAKKIFSFIHQDVAGGITEFMVTVRKREKKSGRYAYQAGSKIILRPQDEDIEDLYDRIYDNYGAGDYMITLRAPKKWADKGIKPETISFTIGNDSPVAEPVKSTSIADDPLFMEMMGHAQTGQVAQSGDDFQRLLLTEASKSQDVLTRFLMMQLQTMQRQIAESNQKMLELSTKPNTTPTQDPMAMVEKTLGLIMPLVTAAKSVSAPAGVDPMQQMTSMMGMFTQVMSLTDKIRGGKDISADGDKDEEPTTVKQKLTNSLVKGADTFVETMAKQLGEKMAPMAMSLAMGQGGPGLGEAPQQQRRIATHKPRVLSVEEQQKMLSDILNNTFAALKAGASNEEAMMFLSSKLKPNVIKAIFSQPDDVIKTSIKEAVPDLEDEKIDSFIKFIKGVNP